MVLQVGFITYVPNIWLILIFLWLCGICSWGVFRVFHFNKLPDYRACVTTDCVVLCVAAFCSYNSRGI